MPSIKISKLCPICGKNFFPIRNRYGEQKYCSACLSRHGKHECYAIEQHGTKENRVCAKCGIAIPENLKRSTKYCSDSCRWKSGVGTEENRIRSKIYRDNNKEKLNEKARERMRKHLKNPDYIARVKRYQQTEKGIAVRQKAEERYKAKRRRHDSHVKAWLLIQRKQASLQKCNAHVIHRIKWIKSLTSLESAKYFKKIGFPWLNPKISKAQKYKIHYKLDLEFRLGEINRLTWRKSELKKRDDGTIDIGRLLTENKKCPYCGDQLTNDNTVIDHMDPLALGGANSQHNLVACCRKCNSRKRSKPFLDWLDMIDRSKRLSVLRLYKRKHGHGPEQQSLTFVFAA